MALNPNFHFHSLPQLSTHKNTINYPVSISNIKFTPVHRIVLAISKESGTNFKDDKTPKKTQKPKTKSAPETTKKSKLDEQEPFPTTIPKKPRRGRRSEAAAVEDFMRSSLEETFAAIKEQNSEVLLGKDHVFKDKIDHDDGYDHGQDDDDDDKKGMVIEEDDPNWPLDAEVGWGIRASEYFEKHPIKNVVGEDGVEIDWEGELDDNLVKEINCLEWESFAFHPSPLIVLVFERYNRASENWRALKELEKAAKVYWNAKDRLPPRTVKLDMNIETDLAYALKIRECPQLLFLRGNRIIYREPHIRTADELVQMIAHFYYKARKPSWLKDAKLYS
ncbi:thioredoxin-like fold domain-containing protein MRL7, chloroplastic [Rutidosis leptorrhynchoides]|uniref:thioredoxin-like fold domain-containing protein MRL7, chloroplastic n=1 Tax=Rutidosis leptorrhynchoides TaxID=125765 RepID=UPI003A99A9DD